MIDFIEYVVSELKSKRLSKANAASLVRQFSGRSSSSAAASVIHPLLQSNTSDLIEQRYSSTFTGGEFFLADHQVKADGRAAQKVLPGVAYLEMARAAIEQALPARPESAVLELRNTVWAQPVMVNGSTQVSIALIPNDNDDIDYEIYSQDADQEIVHCQGRAVWNRQPAPTTLDIELLKGQMLQGTIEPNSLYETFARMGLLYGAAFQGITAIHQGNGQVLAHLRLPSAVEDKWGDYVLHPSLLDSALQACVGLMDLSERSNQPRLPFSLESLRLVSPCTRVMVAWLRYAPGSQAGDHVVKLDVDLCDEQGNVCVEMKGFSSRVLKQEIESGLKSFVPVWNPVRPETYQKTISGSTKILLLGDDQTRLDWVQKSHPNAQMLSISSTSIIDAIQFDHLLWIAPDVSSADTRTTPDDDQIIEHQELGVLAVFRIIKALLRLGYEDRDLRWTIITGKTQRVKQDEPIQPVHAGIFGLVGSLAKEYPHWNLSLLDVDSLESVSAGDCLSIAPDKRGNGLAYRRGEWFRQEFADLSALPQSPPIHYRQKGVYVVIGGAGGLGQAWSRFMIEHFQANIVWIGRHEYDATIEEKIRSLTPLGPAPLYVSADATNFDALEQAFRIILKTYPAIHGVVHSAIVLRDQSIARMDESEFRAGLSAKVDVTVNMDRVFGKQELDFMLFFSSIVSFVKSPGQCNYAAGCTFKDTFAQRLQQQRAYPVKIMNWGYWGKVGIVADEQHNETMKRMGIGSIESNEGMACLQAFVGSELSQMALFKAIDAQALADFDVSESLTSYPKAAVNLLPEVQRSRTPVSIERLAALEGRIQATGMDALLAEILASTLMSSGLLRQPPASFYGPWLRSSIQYLQQRKLVGDDFTVTAGVRPLADLWLAWEEKKLVWAANPDLQAQIALLEACLKGLPGILSGKHPATDVIFPHSSMRLVEGIYRGNAVADFFNDVLGATLAAYLEQKLRLDKEHRIRILEIGAGTGGTTVKLLPLLERFPVDEYCYTDVSKAFLMHAEEAYQPRFPALRTAIFDVSRPLASQSIAAGQYDVVIATNVLHATPNIRRTLRNAKATLKGRGVLLLNEISAWSLFAHVTFGLLEGWWLREDTALRLPGSPGLAPEKWQEILAEEGFESICFPATEAHQFGQQIIAACSTGWVRQQVSKQPVLLEHKPSVVVSTITAPVPLIKESTGAEESLRAKAVFFFQKLVASTLKLRPDQIEPRRPLDEYGLDSILVGQLTYQLRNAFSDVTSTLFFEVQNIDGLVDYFLENKKQELIAVLSIPAAAPLQLPAAPPQSSTTPNQGVRNRRSRPRRSAGVSAQENKTASVSPSIFDVAIIGLSGRYPRSKDLKEFWVNLSNGVNCITEIPRDRWNWEKYYDPEKGKPGKIYTKWGGFIEGVDEFDPLFFKISPQEARRLDPQERIFLESCYHAIEDAGYTPENLGQAEKIGVFAGVMNARYTPQPNHSSIANRISYAFNFQGPSMAVDTACSSSLTAIHVALESIYSGLSECAIAGGVNVIVDPVHYLQLTEITMLSSGKQCKAFGEQADGFVDAEGVGAIILKPLKQAEADGDHIYAVIKGSAVNAGGKTNGYTVPNPKAQSKVVSRALERANVSAEHLSYVEAHGTGTALGDPLEIAGLTRAFKETTGKRQFCSIGSLKSNIGHCESAAGIAGLTKVLLQLKYEQLVPSLHADIPNPEIDFGQTPFKVQQSLEKWQRPLREVNGVVQEIPRIAGISSFGAFGSNAHVIVQEYVPAADVKNPPVPLETTKIIIVLSARSAEQLKQKALDLLDLLREETSSGKIIDLVAIAYTLQVGREAMEVRLGLVVSSVEQLAEKLHAYVAGEQSIEDAYQGQVKRSQEALSLFSTDVDLQQTVDKWVANRKLSKLLELWVKGLDVDWSKLYGDAKPQRMSLPTYPFAKEHYWMDMAANAPLSGPIGATAVLHPLLHRNTSDLSEQRYSSTFTGEEFFLTDHQVKAHGNAGQKVLPGVAYLEMARAAMEQSLPARSESMRLEIRNTVWAQPIVVSENKQIHIALSPNNNDEIDYEIYSEDAGREIVHCQGRAVFRGEPAPGKLDIEQLQGQMGQGKVDPDSVYAACARMGLVYGPSFQGIFAIYRGSGQLLAELRLPNSAVDTRVAGYVLHPSLMDGALQSAVGLVDVVSKSNEPRLPFALETLRIVSPCKAEMVAWVRYARGSQAADNVVKLDIDLCDNDGNVCVQMHGLSSRAAQRQATGRLLATPVWQASSIFSSADRSHSEYSEHHVIVCERGDQQKTIAQRYTEHALACFERIQAILQEKPHGKVLVQIVIDGDQEQALFAGLSGLLKTAALENPQIIGQLILIPAGMTAGELDRCLQQEKNCGLDPLIKYAHGARHVLRWQEVAADPENAPLAFKDDGVYLITGGLGGLGLLFAREILKQTRQARVVLTGRSALSAERQAVLDGLSAEVTRVSYRQVDLGDLDQVTQLIAAIKDQYSRLNGILHSAGMIADNFILKKTAAEFSEVLAPKVTSAYNLDRASEDMDLDFFALFSSLAGATGNVGQADYAAANAFMDQFAAYRNGQVAARLRHGRTRSINWGLWQDGGMGIDWTSRDLLQQTTGIQPMQTATGIDAFYRSLALPYDQILVAEGDLTQIRRALLAGHVAPSEPQAKQPMIAIAIDADSLADKTRDYLRRQFSEVAQLPYHKIDPQAALEQYGIDSILAMKLTNQLEKTFGSLSKTLFFEYQTIAELAGYFVKAHPAILRGKVGLVHEAPEAPAAKDTDPTTIDKRRPTSSIRSKNRFLGSKINYQQDIAVVGLAGRYPQAETLQEFWRNLQNGRDCITEIPLERWDHNLYYDSDRNKLGKSYSKWGGFIADVDKFDPLFFNISPKEAELIDPQERLFLETSWEAIEDAGYTKESISGSRVGVFVGVMWGQYELFSADSTLSRDTAVPSSSHASIANRVSYFFDFHGPSIALDTMCSSSLTAIHLACEELRKGDIEAAVAGGVNVTIHPYKYLSLSQGKFAASDGRCRSFGAGGDGYVPGEGVGAVLLKPLEKALRDGDQIYAVIKSSAVNHGGKTNGYTVPNPNAQGDLILDALRKANIDPKTLSYVETHGTGTSLGDPIEITGLLKAFEGSAEEKEEKQFCPIGSVKSNIGHLESAAGIAAVTKALLQIRHKQLVPSLHADPLNPNINFADSPFYVQTDLTQWKRPATHPRRVGVSSFGAGGSNAHLILEEYATVEEPDRASHAIRRPEAFVLSARDDKALHRYAEKVVHFLDNFFDNVPGVSLANLAYTSQVGRTPMEARLVIIASSVEDLRDRLNRWMSGDPAELEGAFYGKITPGQDSAGTLIEGPAGKAFLEALLANKDLEKIARLWTLGVEIDWSLMHRDATPRKVSLPTYPFAKERCWITRQTPSPRAVRESEPETRRTYYYPEWISKGVALRNGTQHPIGPILILDASDGLFLGTRKQLENGAAADSIVLVKPGKSFEEIEPNVYLIDPEREEHFHKLLENLKSRALLPSVVLHHASEVCNLEVQQDVTQQLNSGLYTLFYLCRALMKEKHPGSRRIMSVFSSHSEGTAPLGAAIGAFFKTLTLEDPAFLAKAVEVDRDMPLSDRVGVIWDELYDQDWTTQEIRYRHARYVRGLVAQTEPERELSPLPLRQDGVYLITGGLGGLGIIFAEYLAKKFQARLVLIGRSAPDAKQKEKLDELQRYGAEILVLRADVSKLEDMEIVVREAKTRFSGINGVIHAAGVHRDAFILKKTRKEMDAVLASKVYGAINTDLATKSENLDLFVLFSSLAGVMGNVGQSDYAYANRFLDAFAEHREALSKAQKRPGRTLSIDWGLWEEGGMSVSRDGIALLAERTGVCPLPAQEGIRCWEDLLRSDAVQGVALYGIPSRIAACMTQQPLQPRRSVPAVAGDLDSATLLAKTELYLKALVGKEIKLDPDRIASSDRLESFGIDSVMINRMNVQLESDLGALPKTLLYEHETVRQLATFLMQAARDALIGLFGLVDSASEPVLPLNIVKEDVLQDQASVVSSVSSAPAEQNDDLGDIAIIGIHGYYPHSANLDEYWDNLRQGRAVIDLVPSNRWDYEEFYHPDPGAAADGKIYCKWGGFLDDHDKFDPQFFKISSAEATLIDPQERLFLQSVWAAIEDAGYTRDRLRTRFPKGGSADVGVFVGVTTNSYHLWAPEEWTRGNFVSPTAMPWSIANRVSYFFDFNGPSLPVDTACSSSLVAIHLACESLRNHQCQVAVAGGVNLYLHPAKYQSLCRRRMLSLNGKCHSYGAGDDGFVPGEGVGTLILKPLRKAIEDQDHIYAVVRASAFDHSGRSHGYSAPNPNAQANLISRTLEKAHIHPETIGYVEGHGTGTQLGDSIEIAALSHAFQKQTTKKQFCPIGSVKANIGHSESAAGIASLAKVILQMKHGQLAPSICSEDANPNIEFKSSPFYLQHGLSEWPSSSIHPRRALINSFGAGGVNACVILEEYEKPAASYDRRQAGPYLFVLSARNEDRLREYADRLVTRLQGDPDIELASLCYTFQVGREAMEERLAIVVSAVTELIDRLGDWSERGSVANVYRGSLGTRRGSKKSKPAKTGMGEPSPIELASLWTAGEEVDWESLYPLNKPRRIDLPTYPFARERYWISDSRTPVKRTLSTSTAQLHPLVSYNSSTLREVCFSSSLSDTEFYAVDHKVNEEAIFPGAGFLEMACISGNLAGEQRVRKLKDIVWIQPLSFRKGSPMLRTFLKPMEDSVEYVISSVDDENETIVHSEGRLVFADGWAEAVDTEERMPLQELQAQCARSEAGAACYDRFREYGLHYGPSFQTIQHLYISGSFALSKLEIADHLKGEFGQFILHPSLIDGALQTVAGLIGGLESGTPHVPFALDEVDIIHPVPQTCYAYAEFAGSLGRNHTGVRKFNIRLLNESGDVLVKFTNLFVRALPKAHKSPRPAMALSMAVAGGD